MLHDTPYKPLICQTYPLVFWKVKPELILAWIYPCRGDGFRWKANDELKITDREIQALIGKISNEFKNYWGEEVDRENPFSKISVARIYEESAFFNKSDDLDLQSKISKEVICDYSFDLLEQLVVEKERFESQEDLLAVINSAFHWLCWSPVGLSLTFINAKLVFLVAANWVETAGRNILKGDGSDQLLNRERCLQQLGSFLITAILPSFWEQLRLTSRNNKLREFSGEVSRVLAGEIPQQDLIQWNH